ncbi:MAG: site-2 protease family protein [Clostridiales bacterium]|jgi:regulator of sigma E protease|nr:site-2 protease family protein [Clostridiales bacterium]
MELFLKILQIIGYVILAFVCLSVMVVLHELGHFIAGRKLGFKVNEFAVGMGPKILSRKLKSGLVLSWRLIPIGGFCAFEGEDEENPSPGAFNNQKPWKRLIVLAAGVVTNFLSAMIVLSLFFTFSGQTLPYIAPSDDFAEAEGVVYEADEANPENSIITVVTRIEGKPIQMLEPADITRLLNGKDKVTMTVIVRRANAKKGETKEIELVRHPIPVLVPQLDGEGKPVLDENGKPLFEQEKDENGDPKFEDKFGILIGYTRQTFGFFESTARAVRFSFFTAGKILSGLGSLFTGANVAETAGGPVTMIKGLTDIVATGAENTIYVICLFSVNLAIFNALPLPALDGGRMVFTIIEWIRKKPLKRSVEAMIHFVGIVLLFGMAILFDILHFFG